MSTLKKLSINGAVGNLEGVVHVPDESPRGIVVVAHPLPIMGGTMDNKVVTTLAKTFVELGFLTLRFNFRGVGSSAGEFDNGNGEVEDVLAIARYAQQAYGDLPLILSGFSFGGYVQARAAQRLHPQQLVLVAPAVGRSVPSFENSTSMPDVPDNTLLIHGDLDEVVELQELLKWARPQHLPVIVLAGAGHFFHGRLTQLKHIVLQHFGGKTK